MDAIVSVESVLLLIVGETKERTIHGRTNVGDSGHENRDFLLPELLFPGRAANKRYRRLYREIRLDSRLPPMYTPIDRRVLLLGY